MFWTYYHQAKSFDKKSEFSEPPEMPAPSLAELADNVTQSWSEGAINWAAVHWEIGTIGLGRWGQPCLECYKTVKNTREYQRWITKRNETMSNHERLTCNNASGVSSTSTESTRLPPNCNTDGAPTLSRSQHDGAAGGGGSGFGRHCRNRGVMLSQGSPSSSVRARGPESENHQPVHSTSGLEELDEESATGASTAGGSAPRRRSLGAKTRIVNLSELYPGFSIPESTILQSSTHIGAGDTNADGGDVYRCDVVHDVVMSILRTVCDDTEQFKVGKDATADPGCLADISEAESEASHTVTVSSSIVGSASSDTVSDSTAESESSDTPPHESIADLESSDTIPPVSSTECESSDTILPASTAEKESPVLVSTGEIELSDKVSESPADGESSVTITPEFTVESVSEREASDKGPISPTESDPSDVKKISVAVVITKAASQSPDKMSVAIVDDALESEQAPSNPPLLYREYIDVPDAVIDEDDDDKTRVELDNAQAHTNSPVDFSDESPRDGHRAYHHTEHVVSIETVIRELERSRAAAEASHNTSPHTSSTHSGTVSVMFGRDVDATGSTSQEDSDEFERNSEWPEATLSVSDKTYSEDDVVSCPQRSPSPLEASVGILQISYSSPCVLLTSPYRAGPPDGGETRPVDQGLVQGSNSSASSSSSEAPIYKPSGDACELYASDWSFVYDSNDDDEYDESDADVDYDVVAGDISDNGVDADDDADVEVNAGIDENVDDEGDSDKVGRTGSLSDLESDVGIVDACVRVDVEVDDYNKVDNDVDADIDSDVIAAAIVDFNSEADFDADAAVSADTDPNVDPYVESDVSGDAVSDVDVVAYSVDAGVGPDGLVDVNAYVDANIDSYVDSDVEASVCVDLDLELCADVRAGPASDVEDDNDVEAGAASDVDADVGVDSAADVDDLVVAGVDTDAVSDVNVPTSSDDGVTNTGGMDERDNRQQQQRQPVIITNIEGPAVVSGVSAGGISSTTASSSASGNAHFLLDKSCTDSDLDISVIYLDRDLEDQYDRVYVDPIADNPLSESSSNHTLQFSSLISDSDFEVPCQGHPATFSTSIPSRKSPGLKEGCYVS
ncbi:serine-aspartate repeat-containing protein I-like [Haliotis cracherodii]|uniref:serine-aspartate repeat-containing protein I-like n=1 Tax=Haliotis cracherodii TaxID=6455 RepID=UPI0039E7E7C3